MSEIKALDELRKYAEQCCPAYEDYDARMMEIADAVEAEIAGRFMELPVDADGVPIHMGDVVEGELFPDNATVRGTVCAYHIHDDDEPGTVYIRVKPTKDTWTIKELQFKRCRHVKPRTIEDVLKDLLKDFTGRDMDYMGEVERANFTERADEIRELMEGVS